MADGPVVHKVPSVANLFLPHQRGSFQGVTHLVVVRLDQLRVGEKVVGAKLEVQLEARLVLVEVRHADILQRLEHLLVAVRDRLGDRDVVSQRGQPELGDAGRGLLVVLVNLGDTRTLLVLVLVVRVGGLTSLDLGVGRFGLAGDDGFPSLVKRGVSVEELRSARVRVPIANVPSSRASGSPSGTRSQSWRAQPAHPSGRRFFA